MPKMNQYTVKTWNTDSMDGFYGLSSFTANSYDESKDKTMVQLIAEHMEWQFVTMPTPKSSTCGSAEACP